MNLYFLKKKIIKLMPYKLPILRLYNINIVVLNKEYFMLVLLTAANRFDRAQVLHH